MGWDSFGVAWLVVGPLATIALAVIYLASRNTARDRAARLRRARETQAALARILRPQDALPLEALGTVPLVHGQAFHGRLRSGREALVRFSSNTELPAGSNPTVEIEAPHAPRVSVRRTGWLDWLFVRKRAVVLPDFVVASLDTEEARKAFGATRKLASLVRSTFSGYGCDQLLLWDGKLLARIPGFMPPTTIVPLLEHLDSIVALFEPAPVKVTVLGGERFALRGLTGSPRCSYCHADVTGDEPDIVACALCHTILHDGCWQELGRCPVLGCAGREPERPGRADPTRA